MSHHRSLLQGRAQPPLQNGKKYRQAGCIQVLLLRLSAENEKYLLHYVPISATIQVERMVSDMSKRPDETFGAENEEFSPTFITITSEDGEEMDLEYVDTLEHNGQVYMAFFPTVPEGVDPQTLEDDEEYGLIILKVIDVDGEEELSTLDSEEEAEEVYQRFMEELLEDEDE